MGCYAAFPALRLAHSLCQNDPNAVVIIQSLELCSLHVQLGTDNPEAMISGSLFADGAGCALISGRSPAPGSNAYRVGHLASTLTPTGKEAMAWEIGNHGFEIVLSSYVPQILGSNIRDAVVPFLADGGLGLSDIREWAVHPGGKAILERIGEALELPSDALAIPRGVLRRFGNMSSATFFFLLKAGLATDSTGPCAAMAFGPGLTVEMALLHKIRNAP
jgi:predicted naringenin-chalcone synthase